MRRRAARGDRLALRRQRLHDREGLLAARADLRPAALAASAPEAARPTARPTRRRSRGWPSASSATASTATSAAAPSYAYVDPARPREAEREAEAAAEAGLPASFVDDAAAVPGRGRRALRRPGRVPRPQVPARAGAEPLDAASTSARTRSTSTPTSAASVKTPGGRVTADRVVVATHYPFLDRSLAFARVHPQRSYALLCRIAGEPPRGHVHLRRLPHPLDPRRAGRRRGAAAGRRRGPPTGEGGDTEERYARARALRARALGRALASSTAGRARTTRRSTTLPYVGPLTPRNDRVLMATGFAKWGMTGGTAAAHDPRRPAAGPREPVGRRCSTRTALNLRAAAPRFVKENAKVGLHFVGDRLTTRGTRPIEDLAPGEGDIVRHAGEKVAGHRRDDGTLVAVSPVCTHLGCQVNWNTAERSWDCPCHGSRFAPDGRGPPGPGRAPARAQAASTSQGRPRPAPRRSRRRAGSRARRRPTGPA